VTSQAVISGWGAIVLALFAAAWASLPLGIGAVILGVDALYASGTVVQG
jgi:hypothetical protein